MLARYDFLVHFRLTENTTFTACGAVKSNVEKCCLEVVVCFCRNIPESCGFLHIDDIPRRQRIKFPDEICTVHVLHGERYTHQKKNNLRTKL